VKHWNPDAADLPATLASRVSRSQRAANTRAFLLVLPLLLLLLVVFILPVAKLLVRSVEDGEVAGALPATVSALKGWTSGQSLPDSAYAALLQDMRAAKASADLAPAATRLNYSLPGMRALLMTTRSRVQSTEQDSGDPHSALLAISSKWATPEPWAAIKQASGPLTDFYLLAALDLKRDASGAIRKVPSSESAFLTSIQNTFEIALGVTLLCLAFGFPFAYLMSRTSDRIASIMIFVVLLPFMTATMVRALAWGIILGREGVINDFLLKAGLIGAPLDLLYNRTAVYVSLLHIFVPYMILPLYGVMKTVSHAQLRAAASLGAPPLTVFRRVYLPQITPGLAAGGLLVFIQTLGVFVVPALLGGSQEQGLPVLIAHYVNKTVNWGLAAALSVILLVSVYILYWLFVRLTKSVSLSLDMR